MADKPAARASMAGQPSDQAGALEGANSSLDGAGGEVERAALDGVADDARALKRALLVQVIGYGLKAGFPVLLALATQAYGVRTWGVFVSLQALAMLTARLSLLGLDKATLWWVGSHDPKDMLRGLLPTAALTALTSSAIAGAVALAGSLLLARWDAAAAAQVPALRIMLLGVPLMAITDVLLHASMGRRKMDQQVAVRDTLAPAAWLGSALLFHALGWIETGLAWAFAVSHAVGLGAALWLFAKSSPLLSLRGSLGLPPRELMRYALPLWLNEVANTTLLRVDTLIVVALTDPFTVGIWGVMSQLGNALRSIRRAFDPILIAVTARISRAHDPVRLGHALSYATQLVSLSQLPVFVFLCVFAPVLLPLYGKGFEQGASALAVLLGFLLVSGGALSLAGVVVAGYGHARWALFVTLIGLAIEVPLLFLLVPRYGLVGAAIGVGAANVSQQLVNLALMARFTGGLHFNERARRPLLPSLCASACALATWLALAAGRRSEWTIALGAFAAFAIPYALAIGSQWKRGLLRAPGYDNAVS